MRYKHIKKKMMADSDEYCNGKIHVEGMSSWKLFDKVEAMENNIASLFEKVATIERQMFELLIKKKGV